MPDHTGDENVSDYWTLLLAPLDCTTEATLFRPRSIEKSALSLRRFIQASSAIARADMRMRNVLHQMLKVAAGQVHERAMIAAFEVDVVGP
ncbi:MAG TPA: hypothetical protein VN623_10460, partial [Hyphomicrobium sp.]|nr:hypothetical protein [Hyphomicrobium sp.]